MIGINDESFLCKHMQTNGYDDQYTDLNKVEELALKLVKRINHNGTIGSASIAMVPYGKSFGEIDAHWKCEHECCKGRKDHQRHNKYAPVHITYGNRNYYYVIHCAGDMKYIYGSFISRGDYKNKRDSIYQADDMDNNMRTVFESIVNQLFTENGSCKENTGFIIEDAFKPKKQH